MRTPPNPSVMNQSGRVGGAQSVDQTGATESDAMLAAQLSDMGSIDVAALGLQKDMVQHSQVVGIASALLRMHDQSTKQLIEDMAKA